MNLSYQDYNLKSPLSYDEAMLLFEHITQKNYTPLRELQNNAHCFVEKIQIRGFDPLVIKVPKYRSKRLWERFLTLFRSGEAFRNYESMMTLKNIGLNGPQPLLAVEKRLSGMVIENLFAYKFIEGKIASTEEIPLILEALISLHQRGFTRSDPKLENFLIHEKKVFFIDFRLKKPLLFPKIQCTFNLCKFFETLPKESRDIYKKPYESAFFNFIYWINDVMIAARKMKKNLKKKLREHS